MRHCFPDFISSERKYRGKHSYKRIKDKEHRCLCASSCLAVCAVTIQNVFYNIKIEVRHIDYAEIADSMVYDMICVVLVTVADLLHQVIKTRYRPLVKFVHFRSGNKIIGIETVQVSENVSCRISDFKICLRKLLEYIV